MTCELSFSSSPSSSPSGVSWKSPIFDSGPTLIASGSSETSSSDMIELPMPKSSEEPIGAEPLKSSGTSSSARPLSEGEMILMPLLSPESVTSLPSPRTCHRRRHRARAQKGRLAHRWSLSTSPPRLISEPMTLRCYRAARDRDRSSRSTFGADGFLLEPAAFAAACALATSSGERMRLDSASRSTSSSSRPSKFPDGLGRSSPRSSPLRQQIGVAGEPHIARWASAFVERREVEVGIEISRLCR